MMIFRGLYKKTNIWFLQLHPNIMGASRPGAKPPHCLYVFWRILFRHFARKLSFFIFHFSFFIFHFSFLIFHFSFFIFHFLRDSILLSMNTFLQDNRKKMAFRTIFLPFGYRYNSYANGPAKRRLRRQSGNEWDIDFLVIRQEN
jgi:hypothetical protein